MGMKIGIGQRILQAIIKIIGQLKLPENEVAQNMLNGSLDQSSLICLGYANFLSKPEREYAYKCYACLLYTSPSPRDRG